MASHSGPPGRGMASLVAPSNGTDLITKTCIVCTSVALSIIHKNHLKIIGLSDNLTGLISNRLVYKCSNKSFGVVEKHNM